eukprot:gnl/TRDRNA2_/TRDRNA2_83015_c0_seq1.p1 gnl/TRDRNA2_/TRDRNA2_83015_c0~~gnl/TRDRNA2_/TRDRNA2_83015_c0_seq1.p1  ORF type:complete len:1090 (+),score=229.66 gnl/TRDRNA2_/TRDRNA2_83015_c0_seq1:103-3372(+)
MADDQEKREVLLAEVFGILDQKRRGFLSRVELAHILDAMQADSSSHFAVPDALKASGVTKDSRVTMSDLRKYLVDLTCPDLEDLKWFAESVVKVESELREVWKTAVQRWRERVECLYKRNLHRYLLSSQPERVSRWLLLRTSMEEVNKDDASIGLLGLGISQQEVEVLFTDETADDINRCSEKIEPFLTALELRDKLKDTCVEGDVSAKCPPEIDQRVTDLLTKLVDLAERARELACLLIHENTLTFVTAVMRSGAFSQAVVGEGSKLIMALINYRVHANARDYEKLCRQLAAEYLEIDFDATSFNLEAEKKILNEPNRRGRMGIMRTPGQRKETIADWAGSLLTLRGDFDRGEMLDMLIKYDERRLLLDSDGGERRDENTPVAVSLLSYGRTVPYMLSRLDVSSHHSVHEHRTPMRTHLWKLMLNVLSGAGERGRILFRAGEGMRVICNVIRGSAWGVEREEVTPEEEEDREEEEELYRMGQGNWPLRDPMQSWPFIEHFEGKQEEHRYYTMDFLDDKFYGSKDRMLATAFLEYMASDQMWGEEKLVEEMMQYPNTLQVFSRVRPPSCFLMRLLLSSPGFSEYLQNTANRIAEGYVQGCLGQLTRADGTCHSLFPTCLDLDDPEKRQALICFQRELVAVEARNVLLRILSNAYHSLQACLQEERSMREGETSRTEKRISIGTEEPLDEATQLEEEITECCKLLASQTPVTLDEVGDITVAIYMQVKDFTRKALLAVNQLPPVNPDERQKARGLEVAKTVPPRPMYFGHYQQLIYNQSNPTQPSTRSMVFEYQARLKCLQGAADILFTGENRYLSEPSLFPYEFLVVLRLVQLIRLREPMVPPFIVELQDLLEQLTGQRSSFIFSDTREDIELAGAEYPWRTGLAQLNTFRVSQVPLRRSDLRLFPRDGPLDVARGLGTILKEYAELAMWEEEGDDTARQPRGKESSQLEALAVRRSVLLALVFNHLCYFHPKMVTLEDSPSGLSLRLGIAIETIDAIEETLGDVKLSMPQSGSDWANATLPENCKIFQSSPAGTITVLQVVVGETKVAFVCMKGIWTLWANCCKDNAQVLTQCENVQKYFSFESQQIL